MKSPNTTTTSTPFPTTLTSAFNFLPDLKPFYPSSHRSITPRPWFLPLTTALFIATSTVSHSTRLKIAIPGLLLLINQTSVSSTGEAAKDFGRACTVFLLVLRYLDFGLGFGEVNGKMGGEVRRVGGKTGNANEKEMDGKKDVKEKEGKRSGNSVWQKLKDGADLYVFNMRGVGWNWEVGGIPERAPQSHRTFLLRTTLRLIGTYLTLDLLKLLSSQHPYIQLHPRPPSSFFLLPLTTQIVLTWFHQLEAFCVINLPYQLLALLSVSLHLHPQSAWPPLFGSLSDAYLISRTWGRVWHQLVRRPLGLLTPHAQHLIRSLPLPINASSRGTKRTISLFSSFFLSGLAHWVGAFNLPWTPSSSGMFWYFMMQAPVIRVEDLVVEWGERRGIKGRRWLRCLGYAWTFAWISWSMRYAAAFQFESGPLGKFAAMRFSLLRVVMGWVFN